MKLLRRGSQYPFAIAILTLLIVPFAIADAKVATATTSPAQSQSATKDAQKIVAILVEFPDVKHSVSRSLVQERLTELDTFYREASYGLAWIKADVTEKWYEVPTPLSKYDIQKWSFNNEDMRDFRRKAITAADLDVNYRNYDYVIIVAAGGVWANAAQSQSVSTNDGVSRLDVIVLNEGSQMGTYAHELGHLVPSSYRPWSGKGLPDLYSYEASEKNEPSSIFVGSWCIMSVSRPPKHFCAWSKIMLGWITPEAVRPSPTQVLLFTIQPLEKDSGLRAVMISLKYDTYYVIEVRTRTGFDRSLPGEGVLIYYVDESRKSGYGVVRVIDRNPFTKTLDDAAFNVGDKFEDDENSVYAVIARVEGPVFTVAISGSKILALTDTDGDGLMDYLEVKLGTDPKNPDTDGDGLLDGEEVNKYGTNPLKPDTDGDGLTDGDEVKKYGTDPLKVDTDGDGLADGEEVLKYGTNPLKVDTDGDGLTDGDEVTRYHTNPLKADTDGDGLTDGEEVLKYGTDPLKPDTDGDGLLDGEEIQKGTNPLKADTDGDLWNDGIDMAPTNPLMPNLLLIAIAIGIVVVAALLVRRKHVSPAEVAVAPAYVPAQPTPTVTPTGPIAVKFCTNCGTSLPTYARHCRKCGAAQG